MPPVGWAPVFSPMLRAPSRELPSGGFSQPCPRHCVRAAKGMSSKSTGLCPRGFESPRCCLVARASAVAAAAAAASAAHSSINSAIQEATLANSRARRTASDRSGCPPAVTPTPARVATRRLPPQRSVGAATHRSAAVTQQRHRSSRRGGPRGRQVIFAFPAPRWLLGNGWSPGPLAPEARIALLDQAANWGKRGPPIASAFGVIWLPRAMSRSTRDK
jgi:hypothetical protein